MDEAIKSRPFIYRYLASPMKGEEIEARSFCIIDKEAPPHSFSPEEWQVVRRMIHTTGEFNLIQAVRFTPGAISSGIGALKIGKPIYVDSRMIQSGLSIPRLRSVSPDYGPGRIICHISDEEVMEQSSQAGLPRSLFAIRKAKSILHEGLAVFGNSPIALLELNRMILEEGIRPAMIIGMPVGFVHVEESKEELMSLDIPYIALAGKRGGSPLAVSVIHALCSIAAQKMKALPAASVRATTGTMDGNHDAIILIGHGSRIPGASRDMEEVARRLKEKYAYSVIEVCSMSGLGPGLPEVLEKCVNLGAKRIAIIPYFLHLGAHILEDIPKMVRKEAQKFPQIEVVLGKGLGFDESLVDLVHKGIQELKMLSHNEDQNDSRG